MRDDFKPPVVAISFYLAFATWLAALRYQAPSFYRDAVSGWFEIALHLIILASLAATLIAILTRSLRQRIWPLAHLLVLIGAIGGAELMWRFWISRGPADFKLVGVVFDLGTPLVAALGIWALVLEVRHAERQPAPIQIPRSPGRR